MASTQLDKLERVKLDNFRLVSKYVFTSKTLAPFNFDENKNTRIVMYANLVNFEVYLKVPVS